MEIRQSLKKVKRRKYPCLCKGGEIVFKIEIFPITWKMNLVGAIAQLVERFVRNEQVRGSNPLSSSLRHFANAK